MSLVISGKDALLPVKGSEKDRIKEILEGFYNNFESKLTAREYYLAAREFFQFVAIDSASSLAELTREHMISYAAWLRDERKLSPNTRLKKLSGVSALVKYLARYGYMDHDITLGVKRPKSENIKDFADISDRDVSRIFEAMNPKSFCYTSHKAALAIGFYTGLRASEIRLLTIKNLSEIDGHRVLTGVKAKGGKIREVPLTPFTYNAIREHVIRLGELGFDVESPDQWLFPALKSRKENSPLTLQSMRKNFRARISDAGVKLSSARRYSCHSMRATVGSHLIEQGVPIEHVQELFGHSSPGTTQKYDKRKMSLDKNAAYRINY